MLGLINNINEMPQQRPFPFVETFAVESLNTSRNLYEDNKKKTAVILLNGLRLATIMLNVLLSAVLGYSSGSGETGVGQSCDAIHICPERNYGGIQVPQVRSRSRSPKSSSTVHCYSLPHPRVSPTLPPPPWMRSARKECIT